MRARVPTTVARCEWKGYPLLMLGGNFRPFKLNINKCMAILEALPEIWQFVQDYQPPEPALVVQPLDEPPPHAPRTFAQIQQEIKDKLDRMPSAQIINIAQKFGYQKPDLDGESPQTR
jgi:hypothetical protein